MNKIILACLGLSAGIVAAAEPSGPEPIQLTMTYRHLMFVQRTWLPSERLDVENRLGLDRDIWVSESRPDLQIFRAPIDIQMHPRWNILYREQHPGLDTASTGKTEHEVYFQTLRMQVRGDRWFVSGGRQALVWGPAFLYAPSNPFDPYTARLEPKAEPDAADYLLGEVLLTDRWSSSLILNTGRGRRTGTFSEKAAIKLDYMDGPLHGAVILAKASDEKWQAGAFSTAHLSEAVIGYAEIGTKDNDVTALLGASYTTWQRWMLTAEYLHQGAGTRDNAFFGALPLRNQDSSTMARFISQDHFPETFPSPDAPTPSIPSLEWPIRKNYLLLQAIYPQWHRTFDVLLQYVHNLDDHSGRALIYGEWESGQNLRLFSTLSAYHGDQMTEFGSLIAYAMATGLMLSF